MKRKFSLRTGLKLIAAIAVTTLTSTAYADEPRGFDWGKALVDLDRFARTGSERPAPPPASQPARPAITEDPNPNNLGNAWFGVAPRVTLVARDWASSTRLAGDRLSIVDAMRLSASTRMVVTRARLSGARFTPFIQIGVGQWRVDRNYLPLTPNSMEVAAQLGTGFELRLTRRIQLAAEVTATSLIREGQNNSVPQMTLWSSFLASRFEF